MAKFKNVKEYAAAREKFYESHPDAPIAEEIECLDLIMKKVYAQQILDGTKKLEFREYKDFYVKRLIDSDVANYISGHLDDEDVFHFCNDIKQVRKIHFHDYNKSWFLDVECDFNDAFSITKHDIEYLQKQYGVHDYDNDLKIFDDSNTPEDERPWLFFFVCGKVIDTNLEIISKEEKFEEICGGVKIDCPKPGKKDKEHQDKDVIKFNVSKDIYNDIVSGKQKFFEKEIAPKKEGLYCLLNEDGSMKEINGVVQLRKYDVIQFVNKIGTYTCKLENADVEFVVVDDVEPIKYTKRVDDYDYLNIVYYLGEEIK